MAALPVLLPARKPIATEGVRSALDAAYLRPCFICGKKGACGHREPEVELAILHSIRKATS